MASTTSPLVTMPRSPWLASAGCRKNAGVPVLASVAAILPPTWPDLPMPETTTRPGAGEQHAAGLLELAAQPVDERGDGARLDPERLASHLDQSLAVGGVVHRVRAASGCGAASYTGPPAALRMPPCRRRRSASRSRPRSRARRSASRSDDGVHFAALVVAPQFEGLRPLQRHQLVYRALGDAMGGAIHALVARHADARRMGAARGLTGAPAGQVPDPRRPPARGRGARLGREERGAADPRGGPARRRAGHGRQRPAACTT